VEITWLGHSCFRLRGRDVTVVTDPFGKGLGYPPLKLTGDVVTVSHAEPNHDAVGVVGGTPRVVSGPGEYEIGGALIQGVATYRTKQKGGPETRNTAFLIRVDEVVICHLGDLGHALTADQVSVLKDPDVLLIPVGGTCTINGAEAAEVVAQLEPKLVVPMHFKTDAVGFSLDALDRFCKEMAVDEVTPQAKLTVTPSSVPDETTVAVLDFRR
jgi:L-ascorbate metabolism protein UlaG (beta-lactamase superfamily)